MRLSDYIRPEMVLTGLESDDRWALFATLTDHICQYYPNIDGGTVLNRLLERESSARTGLENGIAIPHAMIPDIDRGICLLARLKTPLDFGTIDGSPVNLLFLLLNPEDAISSHIRILARIARLCSNNSFIDHMRSAEDAQALYAVVKEEDERHV